MDVRLMGELALEHQLVDRARYLKVLATEADDTKAKRLAERLETAHTATVEWLTTVLAEDALGGPTALRRTPTQMLTGAVVRLTSLPARTLADRVNEAFAQARSERDKVVDNLRSARQMMVDLRDGAVEVLGASRDTGLARAEEVARRDGADDTAEAVHELRRANGSLHADELPIKGYDQLNITETVTAVKKLDKPADVRAVLAYEEAHKDRAGAVSATQAQLAGIAKQAAGIDNDNGANEHPEANRTEGRANGSPHADQLPIKDYDQLNVTDTVTAIKKLPKPEDIQTVRDYEHAHKERPGVISASEAHLADRTKEGAGV